MADVKDAAADQVRRHCPDAFGDDALFAVGDISLAPAVKTVIGLDAAKQQVFRAGGAEDKGFDAGDFHGVPL